MLQKMKTLPTVNTFYVNSLYVSTARIGADIPAGSVRQQASAGHSKKCSPAAPAEKVIPRACMHASLTARTSPGPKTKAAS
jgi:hypothetical protein